MHTHDRTLLSKLGFADPDKKDPRHDLACLYLKEQQTRDAIAKWLFSRVLPGPIEANSSNVISVRLAAPKLEFHLQKGKDQYATTIGFIDAMIQASAKIANYVWSDEETWPDRKRRKGDPVPDGVQLISHERTPSWPLFTEIKITPVSVGDILRQLNLYRTYVYTESYTRPPVAELPYGLLITAWKMSAIEAQAIADAGYGCLTLGESFETWCNAQREGDSQVSI